MVIEGVGWARRIISICTWALKSWEVRLLNTCSSHRHRFSNFHNSSIKKHTFQNQRVGPISGRHSFKAKPLLPLTDRFPSNCYGLWRKHNSRLEKEKQLANRNLSSRSNWWVGERQGVGIDITIKHQWF